MKRYKQAPIWIRRLDLVRAELRTVRFPKTAQEGFRQCAELSETASRWMLKSIRDGNSSASEAAIEQARRLLAARFSAADARYRAQWKKERERYFRS